MARAVRLFIAVNFPAPVREALYAAAAPLRASVAAGSISWVRADALHLTLKFLGAPTATGLDQLQQAVTDVAGRSRSLTLRLSGVGGFPNLRRPRTLWIGVTQDSKLELLQHDVESACAALGYDVGGQPFRPHVTLGRIRRPLAREDGHELARAAQRITFTASVEVGTVDLVSSLLTPSGPRYALLHAASLAAVAEAR